MQESDFDEMLNAIAQQHVKQKELQSQADQLEKHLRCVRCATNLSCQYYGRARTIPQQIMKMGAEMEEKGSTLSPRIKHKMRKLAGEAQMKKSLKSQKPSKKAFLLTRANNSTSNISSLTHMSHAED